jgi:hypothetical protein
MLSRSNSEEQGKIQIISPACTPSTHTNMLKVKDWGILINLELACVLQVTEIWIVCPAVAQAMWPLNVFSRLAICWVLFTFGETPLTISCHASTTCAMPTGFPLQTQSRLPLARVCERQYGQSYEELYHLALQLADFVKAHHAARACAVL